MLYALSLSVGRRGALDGSSNDSPPRSGANAARSGSGPICGGASTPTTSRLRPLTLIARPISHRVATAGELLRQTMPEDYNWCRMEHLTRCEESSCQDVDRREIGEAGGAKREQRGSASIAVLDGRGAR